MAESPEVLAESSFVPVGIAVVIPAADSLLVGPTKSWSMTALRSFVLPTRLGTRWLEGDTKYKVTGALLVPAGGWEGVVEVGVAVSMATGLVWLEMPHPERLIIAVATTDKMVGSFSFMGAWWAG